MSTSANRFDLLRSERFQQLWNRYMRRFAIALFLLVFTIAIGIIGFMLLCDYSLMEAFYMTIITLASVGYGEVRPLDTTGQLFTAFLIIFNMGIFAYAITILSAFLIEGDFRTFLKFNKMHQRIEHIHNHTIICGFGRHGKRIAEQLHKNRQPFVIIEPNDELLLELKSSSFLHLKGDATHDDLLCEAGIQRAKAIIITFGEDAFNVYTVLTARQLNPNIRIITRAANSAAEQKLKRAGADHVVMSEFIGGYYMATLVYQPHSVEFFNLLSNMGNVTIQFKEVDYDELRDEYRDKPLRDVHIRTRTGANIIGLRQKNGAYVVNPDPDEYIVEGTYLVILGDTHQIKLFEQLVLRNHH